jgi:ribose transport system ATP-binding protein
LEYKLMSEYALEMLEITKSFPGVKALNAVTFNVRQGDVHALVGENGAGKSTLMKILGGVFSAENGEIKLKGKKVDLHNTNDAKESGISFIFQEFNLIPSLTVAENAFLGMLKSNKLGVVDWKQVKNNAQKLLDKFNFNLNINALVEDLSVAEKQMLEIAKALSIDAEIIIMDEPSATLTENEIKKLFEIIKDLKAQGVTVIYISHRLEEIFEICDTVTVLRDGQVIDTMAIAGTSKPSIIEKMVGRSLAMEFPVRKPNIGDTILEVKNLSRKNVLKNISFKLRAGEVLGISGLVGSGRTELARAIFGADKVDEKEIIIKGKKIKIASTVDGKNNSLALVPEDRKSEGLVLDFDILTNITVCNLTKVLGGRFFLNKSKELAAANKFKDKLKIKTPSINQTVVNLSGGNQQKVVVAKWLFADADILILDEPTRGIDVGAKYEIYLLINEMVAAGKSVIMISSELPEVLGMSDRILVMGDGEVKGIFDNHEVSPELIIKAAIS